MRINIQTFKTQFFNKQTRYKKELKNIKYYDQPVP